MQKGDDLLDHVNKVKMLVAQLEYFEVPMRHNDYRHNFAWEFVGAIWILVHHFKNNVDKETYDGLRNGAFHAQDVQT